MIHDAQGGFVFESTIAFGPRGSASSWSFVVPPGKTVFCYGVSVRMDNNDLAALWDSTAHITVSPTDRREPSVYVQPLWMTARDFYEPVMLSPMDRVEVKISLGPQSLERAPRKLELPVALRTQALRMTIDPCADGASAYDPGRSPIVVGVRSDHSQFRTQWVQPGKRSTAFEFEPASQDVLVSGVSVKLISSQPLFLPSALPLLRSRLEMRIGYRQTTFPVWESETSFPAPWAMHPGERLAAVLHSDLPEDALVGVCVRRLIRLP